MSTDAETAAERHEKHARKLRKAGKRVAEAGDDRGLRRALDRFGYARNEWWNSIPRDERMMPIGYPGSDEP